MKKLLLILGLFVNLTTACAQKQAPVQSIYDIQPYLEKNLGKPSTFEIAHKGARDARDFTTLYFTYKNRPDLNYKKIAEVLSKAFGEPAYPIGKSIPPIRGGLIPLYKIQGKDIYKVQFDLVSRNPPTFIISISDDKNEIPIPTK